MSDTLVIVLTYGLPEKTTACLRSIREHAPGVDVLWIDNGSDPHECVPVERELLLFGPRAAYLRGSHNLGFPRGMNLGMQYFLDGPWQYAVLQNNDTLIYDDVYATMRAAIAKHPKHGICGTLGNSGWQNVAGTQMLDASDRLLFVGCKTEAARAAVAREHFANRIRVLKRDAMVAYFCTMISRECLEDVGLLDPVFGMGMGEDDDHCIRACRLGWNVIVACGGYVTHDHRSTWKKTHGADGIKQLQDAARAQIRKKYGLPEPA